MTVGGGAIDSRKLTEAVRQACLDAAVSAYEDASLSGLCHEGAWEVAVGAIRSVDVSSLALADKNLRPEEHERWAIDARRRAWRVRLLLQRAAPSLRDDEPE